MGELGKTVTGANGLAGWKAGGVCTGWKAEGKKRLWPDPTTPQPSIPHLLHYKLGSFIQFVLLTWCLSGIGGWCLRRRLS